MVSRSNPAATAREKTEINCTLIGKSSINYKIVNGQYCKIFYTLIYCSVSCSKIFNHPLISSLEFPIAVWYLNVPSSWNSVYLFQLEVDRSIPLPNFCMSKDFQIIISWALAQPYNHLLPIDESVIQSWKTRFCCNSSVTNAYQLSRIVYFDKLGLKIPKRLRTVARQAINSSMAIQTPSW